MANNRPNDFNTPFSVAFFISERLIEQEQHGCAFGTFPTSSGHRSTKRLSNRPNPMSGYEFLYEATKSRIML